MTIKATVNGVAITEDAVRFEFDRLAAFYRTHGVSMDEIKRNRAELERKALDQAIGARRLLERAESLDIPVSPAEVDAEVAKVVAQLGGDDAYRAALAAQHVSEEDFRRKLATGVKVNKVVEQACSGADEPSEAEISEFLAAHRGEGVTPESARDLLRHQTRGRALDAFVEELKAAAKIVLG